MKVILNKDIPHLGEEGDVKDVARGYARNYLYPKSLAVPYNEQTVALFEAKKEEIEAKKAIKRQDAATLKEKLEALEILITVPAGANGKLYGAVTNQTIADELLKQNYSIEKKRIEVPGNAIKSTGKFKVHVRLYENSSADLSIIIQAQKTKEEADKATTKKAKQAEESKPEATVAPLVQETPSEVTEGDN